jgi:hypothetical protein
MEMKKVKMWITLPIQGCKVETEFEVHEDDCSDEDLGEMARDWIWDTIDFGWEVEED